MSQRADGNGVMRGGRLEQNGLETARDGVASGELMRERERESGVGE